MDKETVFYVCGAIGTCLGMYLYKKIQTKKQQEAWKVGLEQFTKDDKNKIE